MNKKVCVMMLLAMMATAALCGPMAEPESAKRGLQKKEIAQLREAVRDMNDQQDYTGWMDFGRRNSGA
uniref:Caerulein 1 n=1 Tax=Ranoidea splendida TaxID=30345 RepID=D3WKE2_RANSP|nr:caerulein precursor 1 [Ranoidea splendida]